LKESEKRYKETLPIVGERQTGFSKAGAGRNTGKCKKEKNGMDFLPRVATEQKNTKDEGYCGTSPEPNLGES